MAVLMIPVAVALLGVIFIKPKWGTFLIWPILFTYPHTWWYYHQYLPLNIGVDDLLCLVLLLVVLVRRNLLGGVPIRFGYAFWVVTLFTLVAAVATAAGARGAAPGDRLLYLKDIMKLGIYWALFYSVLHCIDDERDLRIQFTMFSLAAVAGALIVILQHFFPHQMAHWANPLTVEERGIQVGGRATGAFLNANGAACVLTCSLMLVITAIRLQKGLLAKVIVYSFVSVLLIAVLLTRSRSGLMALGGTLVLMAFLAKSRKVAWLVIVAAVCVGALLPSLREEYERRIARTYDPTLGTWGRNIEQRFDVWRSYFQTAGPLDYLLGQGRRQGIVKNRMETHSTYVSLITVYGLGGIVWAIAALTAFLRRVRTVRACPSPLVTTAASGCMWALVAWGIYSLSADAVGSQYSRYLLFYVVVIVDRAAVLAAPYQEGSAQVEESSPGALQYQLQ